MPRPRTVTTIADLRVETSTAVDLLRVAAVEAVGDAEHADQDAGRRLQAIGERAPLVVVVLRRGLAVVARDHGEEVHLVGVEALELGVAHEVVAVLVVAAVLDVLPDVVDQRAEVEHLPFGVAEAVEALRRVEERQREARDVLAVLRGVAVARGGVAHAPLADVVRRPRRRTRGVGGELVEHEPLADGGAARADLAAPTAASVSSTTTAPSGRVSVRAASIPGSRARFLIGIASRRSARSWTSPADIRTTFGTSASGSAPSAARWTRASALIVPAVPMTRPTLAVRAAFDRVLEQAPHVAPQALAPLRPERPRAVEGGVQPQDPERQARRESHRGRVAHDRLGAPAAHVEDQGGGAAQVDRVADRHVDEARLLVLAEEGHVLSGLAPDQRQELPPVRRLAHRARGRGDDRVDPAAPGEVEEPRPIVESARACAEAESLPSAKAPSPSRTMSFSRSRILRSRPASASTTTMWIELEPMSRAATFMLAGSYSSSRAARTRNRRASVAP